MIEELIIDGQHVDLSGESGITLEYVSNLLNDPGKLSLSHSYTVKLPRTTRNASILDLPERPAHESAQVRRYLPCRYYRNGINLIGDNARAYITNSTRDQYEIVIVWDDIPELRALSESKATINDLPDLPRMNWKGWTYGLEKEGALFAKYTSSNAPKDTENVNELIHPCMRLTNLLGRIMNGAGVPYSVPEGPLDDLVVLAAPDHKPDAEMLRDSATTISRYSESIFSAAGFYPNVQSKYYGHNLNGVDITSPLGNVQYKPDRIDDAFVVSAKSFTLYVHFNTDIDKALDDAFLVVLAAGSAEGTSVTLAEMPLQKVMNYHYALGTLQIELPEGYTGFRLRLNAPSAPEVIEIEPYGYGLSSLFEIVVPFDHIIPTFQNVFPLGGNLPDLEQWAFVRNCMLIGGLTPVVSRTGLRLHKISDFFDVTRAEDWTGKLNMASALIVKPTLSSWAQNNLLKFAENPDLSSSPGFSLTIQDETLKANRDWASLNFAASLRDIAVHYKSTDEGATYEDVAIEPRFFLYNSATRALQFEPELYGAGLKAKYEGLQDAIERPVILEAQVRLSDVDLATLDITRPVYLAQYGRYYHILKVQTSNKGGECKVELLQIR